MMPPGKPPIFDKETYCVRCGKHMFYCTCAEAEPVTHWDWDERADWICEDQMDLDTEDRSK